MKLPRRKILEAGVAEEIVDTWNDDHGRDATPEQIVGYHDALVFP